MGRILAVGQPDGRLQGALSVLQDLPCEVQTVSERECFQEGSVTLEPQLILLGTSGSAALDQKMIQRLRAHEPTRCAPILLVGIPDRPEARRKAYRAGATDVVPGLLIPEEVLAKVRNGLALGTHLQGQLERLDAREPEDGESSLRQLTEAQEVLRRNEEFLQSVFDGIQDGISVLDRDLTVLRTNRWMERKYAAHSPLVGSKCYRAYQGLDEPCRWCPSLRAMETGEPQIEVVPFPDEEAPSGWIELSAFPLRDEEGQVVGVIEHVKDISARVQAEEEHRELEAQVRHAQKLESLGLLAGGIAHDFNNLLVAILGNAELARIELPPESPARQNLQELERSARRAAALCRQLLAYSGKGQFVIRRLDLSRMVEEMAHLLEVSLSKKASIRYRLARDLPAIEADVSQIHQVVMNLITNASEAIGEGPGEIILTTGLRTCTMEDLRTTYLASDLPEGPYVYLEVTDTGVGMDEGTLERLFDPFFSTKFAGRGLGMAAVLGIVRGHKGVIRIESNPGEGSTVTVLFPAVAGELNVDESAVVDIASIWRGSGTILLVDDEATVRSMARKMLIRLGFQVLEAIHGREALEILEQQGDEVDCVLLDLTMPEMGGKEAYDHLQRLRPELPVIVSSGYNEKDALEGFPDPSRLGFIQKPYRLAELAAEIQRLLRSEDG